MLSITSLSSTDRVQNSILPLLHKSNKPPSTCIATSVSHAWSVVASISLSCLYASAPIARRRARPSRGLRDDATPSNSAPRSGPAPSPLSSAGNLALLSTCLALYLPTVLGSHLRAGHT